MKPFLIVFLLLAVALSAFADPSLLAPGAKGFEKPEGRSPGNPLFTRSLECWQTKACMPESICSSVVVPVTLGGRKYIYSIGGYCQHDTLQAITRSIYIYDIASDSWARSSVLVPTLSCWAAGVACGGKVYIFGGWGGLRGLRIFNPQDSSWTTGALMPVGCYDQVAFAYQDSLLFVVGGVTTFWTGFTKAVQIYNRNQNTWVRGTDLPVALGAAGGGVVGNTAVFSCGIGASSFVSDTTYEGAINPSNPTQITWTAVAGSPYPGGERFRVTSGTVGNQVFVGNGYFGWGGGVTWDNYSYDPSTHTWTQHANKPTAIAELANYAVVDSVLYVPGGYRDIGNMILNVHEALNLKLTGVEEGSEVRGQKCEVRIKATPNPFTSFASVPGRETERFALYDVSGRKAGVFRGDRIGWGLSPGVYFLRPESGSSKPLRIVKLR